MHVFTFLQSELSYLDRFWFMKPKRCCSLFKKGVKQKNEKKDNYVFQHMSHVSITAKPKFNSSSQIIGCNDITQSPLGGPIQTQRAVTNFYKV